MKYFTLITHWNVRHVIEQNTVKYNCFHAFITKIYSSLKIVLYVLYVFYFDHSTVRWVQ